MTKYRKRYYKKYSKKSWSPNIQEILTTTITTSPGTFFTTYTLTTNPIQDTTTVSQTYTVKNFDINFYIDDDNDIPYLDDICCYIMYVPQGMTVTDNYNILHPEYIMNYKYLGGPFNNDGSQNFQPFRIKSRLARKLNTGDSVQLFIKGVNSRTSGTTNFKLHGIIRWWTKAN